MPEQDASAEDIGKIVLLLEDRELQGVCIKATLEEHGYITDWVRSIGEARRCEERALKTGWYYFAAIIDMCVPFERGCRVDEVAGLQYAIELRQMDPDIRIALHTCTDLGRRDVRRLMEQGIVYFEKATGYEKVVEFLKADS